MIKKKTGLCDQSGASIIIGNVPEICEVLERLEISIVVAEYEDAEELRNLFNFFMGVGTVYSTYIRKNLSDREAFNFLEWYKQETRKRLRQISDFASGEELQEIIASLVWSYITAAKSVILVEVNKIDRKAYKAPKENYVIVYDDRFYYFPPELLIKICEPLLQTVSEPELKKRLKGDGIIYCNSADYTVKKALANIYGVQVRQRFLWVNKEYLFSLDNLRLEDVLQDDLGERMEDGLC